jgi:FKBP-type peptidyl-prolyl cis-trans isomerase
MRSWKTLLVLALAFLPIVARAQREKLSPDDLAIVEEKYPTAKRTSTGLRTILEKAGTGDLIHSGDMVDVLYVGKFLNGKVFEDAKDRAHPFTFRVGRGVVIDGWEEGLQMMREGEKRIFIVPYELGYGSRGNPPRIPRETTLVFDIEVVGVHREGTVK